MTGKLATRDAYGKTLLELAQTQSRIVVLDTDLSRSTRTDWFQAVHADRFFNIGIAEANMFGIAAGLARTGKIPFATTYAVFIGRGFEQIRQSIAYPFINVKIVGAHGGLSTSHNGGSHQAIEDIALMRSLPSMIVVCPIDYTQTQAAVRAAAAASGPVYIRLSKDPTQVLTNEADEFGWQTLNVLRRGDDAVILVTGVLAGEAVAAADSLLASGIKLGVIGVPVIKPLNIEGLMTHIAHAPMVFTLEEHSIIGGLGSACAESLAALGYGKRVIRLGIPDVFGQTGDWVELLGHFGLDRTGIVRSVVQCLQFESNIENENRNRK